MDDILLLDAIERYRKGEMTAQEKTFFEELRKNNPDIDQVAVEHIFFLQELDNLSEMKAFKHSLNEVENVLMNEGVVSKKQLRGKAKVVYLWNRYRRTVAVAASIAIIVSISAALLTVRYSDKKDSPTTLLVNHKLNVIDKKLNDIQIAISNGVVGVPPKPKFSAKFGATSFLIDGSGYLVTNAHVVNNAKNLVVENSAGDQFIAVAVYINKTTDMAILKIRDTSFKKINILPYSIPRSTALLGSQIFTLGFPREEVVYGEGYLSAKSGLAGDTTSYQVNVSVNPGNSGGPVFNKNGEVIGIISSKETNADGVVYAIKSNNIYKAVEEIKNDEPIKLPTGKSLKGVEREQQIQKIEDCVFMVKGN